MSKFVNFVTVDTELFVKKQLIEEVVRFVGAEWLRSQGYTLSNLFTMSTEALCNLRQAAENSYWESYGEWL